MMHGYITQKKRKILVCVFIAFIGISSALAEEIPTDLWMSYIESELVSYFDEAGDDISNPNGSWNVQYTRLLALQEFSKDDWFFWHEISNYQDLLQFMYFYDDNDAYLQMQEAYEKSINIRNELLKTESLENISTRTEPDLVKGYRYLQFARLEKDSEIALRAYDESFSLLDRYSYGYLPLEYKMAVFLMDEHSFDPLLLKPYGDDEEYRNMYNNSEAIETFSKVIQYGDQMLSMVPFPKAINRILLKMVEANAALGYSSYYNKDADKLREKCLSADSFTALCKKYDAFYAADFYSKHLNLFYYALIKDHVHALEYVRASKEALDLWNDQEFLYFFNPEMVEYLQDSINKVSTRSNQETVP